MNWGFNYSIYDKFNFSRIFGDFVKKNRFFWDTRGFSYIKILTISAFNILCLLNSFLIKPGYNNLIVFCL